jgi:hypothetical protein
VAASHVRSRISHILIAGGVGLVLSAALLGDPGHSRGASQATQPSSQVVVIPSFAPQRYPGTNGIPPLPVGSSQLAPFRFAQLAAKQVTSAALSSYDTVILYGIRWSDIPASGRAAIDSFAATHKVVIWDADDTGSQPYSDFIHPFSTVSTGETGLPGSSVVTYPTGTNFLASDNPSSPYYLDPDQLVTNQDMINHMNAMQTGTQNWAPALVAANNSLPQGGWAIAWSYGDIGKHTGLAVYSGIDADAFSANLSPNYAVKEMALDLAAPFRQTPDSSCAPTCQPPSSGGPGPAYSACGFTKRVPTHWVHGRVALALKTSVAAGITGKIVSSSGRVLASGREGSGGLIRLVVRTNKLRSNRVARLRGVVFYKGQQVCTKPFRLKVDNIRPRLLRLATLSGPVHLLSLRVGEKSWLTVVASNVHRRPVLIPARRTITVRLPASVKSARLILRDRAGNTVVRRLVW